MAEATNPPAGDDESSVAESPPSRDDDVTRSGDGAAAIPGSGRSRLDPRRLDRPTALVVAGSLLALLLAFGAGVAVGHGDRHDGGRDERRPAWGRGPAGSYGGPGRGGMRRDEPGMRGMPGMRGGDVLGAPGRPGPNAVRGARGERGLIGEVTSAAADELELDPIRGGDAVTVRLGDDTDVRRANDDDPRQREHAEPGDIADGDIVMVRLAPVDPVGDGHRTALEVTILRSDDA